MLVTGPTMVLVICNCPHSARCGRDSGERFRLWVCRDIRLCSEVKGASHSSARPRTGYCLYADGTIPISWSHWAL